MRIYSRLLLLLATVALALAACGGPATTAAPPPAPADTQAAQPAATSAPPAEPTAAEAATSAPAPAAGIDACALLTPTDAEAILGGAVGEPEHPIEGSAEYNVTSCSYKGQDGSSKVSLIVSVPYDGAVQSAQIAFKEEHDSAQDLYGVAPVDVPGLGDNALWVGGSLGHIAVLKGNVFFTLRASNYQDDTAPQPVIDLANVVIGRLP